MKIPIQFCMSIPAHLSDLERFQSRILGWYNGASMVLLLFFIGSDYFLSGSVVAGLYSLERNFFLFVMLALSSVFLHYRKRKVAGPISAISCLLALEAGIMLESVNGRDPNLGLVICGLAPVLLGFSGLFLAPKVNIVFSFFAALSLGVVSYFQPWSSIVHAYVFVLMVLGSLGAGILSSVLFQRTLVELSKLHQERNRLFNEVPVTISVISKEGIYLEVNRTLTRLFGAEFRDIVGKKVGFLSGDYSRIFSTKFAEFVASKDTECEFELVIKNESKRKEFEFPDPIKSITIKLLKDSESNNIIAVGIDRTILQRLELSRSEDEKWIGLGQMAGGIGHEINNPLAIIMGTVEQLQDKIAGKFADDPDVQRAINILFSQVHRISNIVRSLKRFSRKSKDDPLLAFGIADVVEESLELCKQGLKASGIQWSIEPLALPKWKVECRPSDLMQVFVNLISNAQDALDESEIKEKWIRISVSSDDGNSGYLIVRFTDAGIGISESLQKKIFDPFFTTKDVGKGTGLGLSLSRKIIEEHGGQLYYELKDGHTTFSVFLPSITQSKEAAAYS